MKPLRKRFIVHPGFIVSKYDGQEHYISCKQLCELYGVDIRECFLNMGERSLQGVDESKFIHLYPDYDGDYSKFWEEK